MHYTLVGNYIKAHNTLRAVIYRDIQRVNCSYKHIMQYSPCHQLKIYRVHVIFAMLPSKRNHTSLTFKDKYKS